METKLVERLRWFGHMQRGFIDEVTEERAGVTEEDARYRVTRRQMICCVGS